MSEAAVYTLKNESVEASISSLGAECISLKYRGLEYLWQADPAVWGRHAPVLFPIVGRLKNDSYQHAGQTYSLNQHGFARDCSFQLLEHSEQHLSLVLNADRESLKRFPFDFELIVRYTLSDSRLQVDYRVNNPSAGQELFFSIGAHPGFRCPLLPDRERFEDYELDFGKQSLSSLPIYALENGLIGRKRKKLDLKQGKLPMGYDLFRHDALIFDVQSFTGLRIRSKKTGKGYAMQFPDFRWLGLWTKEDNAGFVCIEPWNGIADTTDHDGELKSKLGIIRLSPGSFHAATYQVELLG
ncbi:Galactose mutarotase [Cyclobacterium lianum]|uniref:Galactose mutarotase n=1 Tax=Cyclobacterium lianum TaxID=388280 RepID=A0A1M7PD72_9BACT|nr:aldose 1-epimerase family protein [Cyclobacterium lianum]SHN14852.1 Galactose mutarotase [Cyclobacterium lianum]